jgi:hypothetical protein
LMSPAAAHLYEGAFMGHEDRMAKVAGPP